MITCPYSAAAIAPRLLNTFLLDQWLQNAVLLQSMSGCSLEQWFSSSTPLCNPWVRWDLMLRAAPKQSMSLWLKQGVRVGSLPSSAPPSSSQTNSPAQGPSWKIILLEFFGIWEMEEMWCECYKSDKNRFLITGKRAKHRNEGKNNFEILLLLQNE